MPMMTVNVDALQGETKLWTIAEAVPGEADVGGSFTVLVSGGLSETIAYNEGEASMATKLSGVVGQTVGVTRSNQNHGKYAWIVTLLPPRSA